MSLQKLVFDKILNLAFLTLLCLAKDKNGLVCLDALLL
jgi:hypothetical protein